MHSSIRRSLLLMGVVVIAACSGRGDDETGRAARNELNPPESAYTQAAPCAVTDSGCQTLVDFYDRKPGFKELLLQALAQAEIPDPNWLGEALTSRVQRTTLNDAPYIVGRACEPRNCAQVLYVAFNEVTQQLFGFYRSNSTLRWFGNADEAQMAFLCARDQLCQLEAKVSELRPVLGKLGFPEWAQLSDFASCYELKGGISTKDGFVCKEQFAPKCPYTTNGCAVNAEFVNEELASISFKYKFKGVKNDELKRSLDQAYGKAEVQVIKPDASGTLTSWNSSWSTGRVLISMKRIKGRNAQGEGYDDLWVTFADTGFALFNK